MSIIVTVNKLYYFLYLLYFSRTDIGDNFFLVHCFGFNFILGIVITGFPTIFYKKKSFLMFKRKCIGILETWWLWQNSKCKIPYFAHENSTLRGSICSVFGCSVSLPNTKHREVGPFH